MEPDDKASRKYYCAVPVPLKGRCNTLTGRRLGTNQIPVCGPHFVQGWGRLPGMILEGQEEVAPLYVSDKDKVSTKKKTRR